MRIITGEYKGRKLQTPPDYSVRPTSDKVKEALFSILTGRVNGSCVLDLFSGTGNLGLEALSRGADFCVFGDNSKNSIRMINENIRYCRASEKAEVFPGDFRKLLMNTERKFDIIFLDPPYDKGMIMPAAEIIQERGLLAEDGIIIAEHRKQEDLPQEMYGLEKVKERRYGSIMLSIYC